MPSTMEEDSRQTSESGAGWGPHPCTRVRGGGRERPRYAAPVAQSTRHAKHNEDIRKLKWVESGEAFRDPCAYHEEATAVLASSRFWYVCSEVGAGTAKEEEGAQERVGVEGSSGAPARKRSRAAGPGRRMRTGSAGWPGACGTARRAGSWGSPATGTAPASSGCKQAIVQRQRQNPHGLDKHGGGKKRP